MSAGEALSSPHQKLPNNSTAMPSVVSEPASDSTASFPVPAVKLVQARNQRQIEKTLKENYSAWGGSLSYELYVQREQTLANQEFAKSSQKTWVLIDQEKNEATCLDIFTSCETYYHECLIALPPNQVHPSSNLLYGKCLDVASVFTPEKYRKKGYAAILLSKLLDRARNMDNVIASTLFSDIGPSYYTKLGWKCYPSYSLCQDLDDSKTVVEQLHISVDFIELPQTASLIEKAASDLPSTTTLLAKTLGKPVFSMIPSFKAQSWLWARTEFYFANLYTGSKSELKYCGIKCKTTEDFVLFMLDFKESILKVTLARLDDKDASSSLLLALAAHARDWKLKRIEIWDPSADLQKWALPLGYRLEARNDHLSSLCLSGFSHSAATINSATADSDATWLHNEKLFWV